MKFGISFTALLSTTLLSATPVLAEQNQPFDPARHDPAVSQLRVALDMADAAMNKLRDAVKKLESDPAKIAPTKPTNPVARVAGQVGKVADGLNFKASIHEIRKAKSAAPDVVGAFRFICKPGQLAYNDPLVYPQQTGASHLHQFFGNLEADANSTYESLRASGESTCTSDLNRSAYWIPALLTGDGNVVQPEHISVYYKRRPANDPWFTQNDNTPARLPRGLSYIFGWDASKREEKQDNHTYFKCHNREGKVVGQGTMKQALVNCPANSLFRAQIKAPGCWDGKSLTAADFRSHTSYGELNRTTGKHACPQSHRYVLPAFTLTVRYKVEPGDKPRNWRFASDEMVPEKLWEPGYSFHADWFGAWNDAALDSWQDNCIDKMLNCSDGDLGNGTVMTRNRHRKAKVQHLVPVPPRPGKHAGH